MTTRSVTLTSSVQLAYWMEPQGSTAAGDHGAAILQGFIAPVAFAPLTVTLSMDDALAWDVRVIMRGAPPISFEGFIPADGELDVLLAAQGWMPL
jgi:hypothetical protein